jgi:hypothetical protein
MGRGAHMEAVGRSEIEIQVDIYIEREMEFRFRHAV